MVYLLIVIGLVLIYISLKFGKTPENKSDFNSLLKSNLDSRELENIKSELQDFRERLDNIEDSMLLINEKLHRNNKLDQVYENNEDTAAVVMTHTEKELVLQEEIKESLNSSLYRLFDEGKTVDEISSITRIGKGEILLRLGLRKQ